MVVNVPGASVTGTNQAIHVSNLPETINIYGAKTWEDGNDQDGLRPESITIRLMADGEEKAQKTVTEKEGWEWTFDGLPRYENGVEITYTLAEDPVPGYNPEIDGFDVTNRHTPETISLSGKKTWEDANDQDGLRPESITIRLMADGEEKAQKTVTEEDG